MKPLVVKTFYFFWPLIALLLPAAGAAQSTDPNFPTPVTSAEISGTIKARDIGDSRLTNYYYTFDGGQGDIFINVVSKNFTGDIDVFLADALRPLTKIVIYADASTQETGRLIYLRKSERLILRIEGRSPNDDPAAFRIKFGGSFIAMAEQKAEDVPAAVRAEREEGPVRVNSVGTILPSSPKPKATPKPAEKEAVSSVVTEAPKTEPAVPSPEPTSLKTDERDSTTVFENKAAKVVVESETKPDAKRPPRAKTPPGSTPKTVRTARPPAISKEAAPDPLANIRLVIHMKDGTTIERPMSEVLRFNVVNGILTVTGKDGKVSKFSILDTIKVTIE